MVQAVYILSMLNISSSLLASKCEEQRAVIVSVHAQEIQLAHSKWEGLSPSLTKTGVDLQNLQVIPVANFQEV